MKPKGRSCGGDAQHEKRHGGMVCGCGFGGCEVVLTVWRGGSMGFEGEAMG